MADSDGTHIYGGPDPKDADSPPVEGLRGEQAGAGDRPDLRRTTMLSDGRTVEIEETSGVAAAEERGAGQDAHAANHGGQPAGKSQD